MRLGLRQRSPRLRSQLVLGIAVLVAVILGLAGLTIVVSMDRQDRHRLDDQLEAQADKVLVDYDKTFAVDPDKQDSQDDPVNTLLAGSPSLVRVISQTSVVAQRGDIPVDTVPIPTTLGFSTVKIGKEPWRSFVVDIASTDYRLQVLSSLAPVERRFHDNQRLVAFITALATALAAIGSWLVSGLVLRPLERLTRAANRLTTGLDVAHDLPEVRRPREVSELSASLNSMLTRQRASIDATRRFTADAGHELRTPLTALGTDLETLRRNPAMSDSQRDEILTAMTDDQRSVVELLDGLQTLARGDAHALPATNDLDITELVSQRVDQARRRYPHHTFTTDGDLDREVIVSGWPDGLRLAVTNILDNAALHGGAGGTVAVTLRTTSAGAVAILIDDNGPGIPPDELDAVRNRFTRGRNARGPGSGLGMALVEQQMQLHNGTLDLSPNPAGAGLRVTLTLPTATWT